MKEIHPLKTKKHYSLRKKIFTQSKLNLKMITTAIESLQFKRTSLSKEEPRCMKSDKLQNPYRLQYLED
jgi:hypothetical protein